MRVRNVNRRAGEEIELQMTPMIDIVFQLLIFFIMTFKIVAPEGDFNIKMPLAAPSQGPPEDVFLPPITVRLIARSNGELSEIRFGTRVLGRDFNRLRQAVLDMTGDEPDPSVLAETEVEFDCDYHLRYENVIEAITAVSGYVVKDGPDRGQVVKVIEKIKFAPPRR
ncbi:MAG: biopolymer transporter ExbD [Planctomycetes bacterium]|nr:biopolymer transporter ExbD [Planctomycetota bacterium]